MGEPEVYQSSTEQFQAGKMTLGNVLFDILGGN
jgi:hypothetical protein